MVKLLAYSTSRLEQLGVIGSDADTAHRNMGELSAIRVHKKKRKGHNSDLTPDKNEVETEEGEEEEVGISIRSYRLQKLGACISAWRMMTDACLGLQGQAMYGYHSTADTASAVVSTQDINDGDTGTHPTSTNAAISAATNPVSALVELTCAVCGVSGGSVARCSQCKSVSYCGVKHQKQHWTVHKVSYIYVCIYECFYVSYHCVFVIYRRSVLPLKQSRYPAAYLPPYSISTKKMRKMPYLHLPLHPLSLPPQPHPPHLTHTLSLSHPLTPRQSSPTLLYTPIPSPLPT